MRRHPARLNRCTRYLPSQDKRCGKSARFGVYGTQALCKECYKIFKARPGQILFDPGCPPTVQEEWEARQRLVEEVPERTPQLRAAREQEDVPAWLKGDDDEDRTV